MLIVHRRLVLAGFGVAAALTFAGAAFGLGSDAAPANSNAALSPALRADLNAYLTAHRKDEHISTLSFSVSFRNNPTNLDLAVGTTRYKGGVAVTPANLFQTGSNTKAFTAVAVLQLEAARKLSIHDTVGRWLPQYPAWRKITIQQLLNMTSGISTYDLNPKFQADLAAHPHSNLTPAQLVAYVYPRFKPPGKQYEYSNTSYILVQMIIERAAASHSYKTEIDRIIASVGLKNTFYMPDVYPPSVASRVVSGYFAYDGPDLKALAPFLRNDISGNSLSWLQGVGNIVATPEDLTKWARALYESTALLAPMQRRELMSAVSMKTGRPITRTSAGDPKAFGLGVIQAYDKNRGIFWYYTGETLGFRAVYEWFPKQRVVFSLAVNSFPRVDHINDVIDSLTASLRRAGTL